MLRTRSRVRVFEWAIWLQRLKRPLGRRPLSWWQSPPRLSRLPPIGNNDGGTWPQCVSSLSGHYPSVRTSSTVSIHHLTVRRVCTNAVTEVVASPRPWRGRERERGGCEEGARVGKKDRVVGAVSDANVRSSGALVHVRRFTSGQSREGIAAQACAAAVRCALPFRRVWAAGVPLAPRAP